MVNHSDIVPWLREMGYNGEMPEDFICICNNATNFVWEQLIQNVHPKQKVDNIRRNIVLNRLKTKPLNKQDDFLYKVKEIEQYKQKLGLEQKLKILNDVIEEKRYKVEQLSQNCKMKDVCVDFLKKKIKQNELRHYLLDAKRKQLELQNKQADETLTKLKNVTPIEREDGTTAKEITETLEKCAEKLNKIILENQKVVEEKLYQPSVAPTTVIKNRTIGSQLSIATYLSLQEKENFEEIARSCKKKDKENVDSNIHRKVRQKMFATSPIIIEEETNSFKQLGVSPFDKTSRPTTRESLGLLPDSCLDEININNSFLCSEVSQKHNIQMFRKTYKTPSYHDIGVNRALEKLLSSNNRELIYEMLVQSVGSIHNEFTQLISMEDGADERQNELNEDHIAKLRFIHVQTELKIVEQKKVLKNLVANIGRRKLQVLNSSLELQEWLDSSIQQVALDASLAAIKKEIHCSKTVENNDNELQVLLSKIAKTKNDIANKIQLIQLTLDDMYNTHKSIAATRESVLSPIWHIKMLKTDPDWMNPLLENSWSEEMRIFESFPLEYHRRFVYTEPKSFYRDLYVDNYPQSTEITSEHLQLISEILESPFSPPETILLNIVQAKIKMNVLKSIKNRRASDSLAGQYNINYSFEELRQQESYLEFALNRFKALMCSSNAGKVLSMGEVVKQGMDFWANMPMKQIISHKRLVQGHNYQFYQKKLEEFL